MSDLAPKRGKSFNTALITLFLAAICLPLTDTVLSLDRTRLSASDASPVRLPGTLGPRELIKYAGTMKWQLQTTFGFKAALVRLHGTVKVKWLGISASPRVVLGKDGWLFLADERTIDDCCGLVPFTDEELRAWRNVLEARDAWFAERGITYLLVIAPDKHSVYGEYLPESTRQARGRTRLDQLVGYLERNSRCRIVDARPALRNARLQRRVYNRTDSHWNDVGGFIASQEIAARLSSRFSSIMPASMSDCTLSSAVVPGGDLARFLGLKFDMTEDCLLVRRPARRVVGDASGGILKVTTVDVVRRDVVVTECPDGEVPRAVVFRDSFGEALMPWLSEHFKRAVYVWSDELVPDVIERERPDVVIQEFIERRLLTMRPENPEGSGGKMMR